MKLLFFINYPTNGSINLSTPSFGLNGGAYTNNQWYHLAATRSGSTTRLFVNGVLKDSSTTSFTFTTGQSWLVGDRPSGAAGGNYPFNGYVCDARLIKGTALYTSAFTPPTAPLTAVTNTSLLLNFTNAGIPDSAMINDFETNGAQLSTSVKKYGTASVSFNGSSDYLSAPDSLNYALGSGNWTIEGWFYLASITTQQTLITKGGQNPLAADQDGWSVFIYTSTLYFFIRDGSGSGSLNNSFCTSGTWSSSVSNNTWFHLAIVRSGTTITAYVNGTSVGTLTSSANPVTTDPLVIGRAFTAANYMNGYIDDLRVTKGYARYTANFTPPPVALPTY